MKFTYFAVFAVLLLCVGPTAFAQTTASLTGEVNADGTQLPRQPADPELPWMRGDHRDALRVRVVGSAWQCRQQEQRHPEQRDAVDREVEQQRSFQPAIARDITCHRRTKDTATGSGS